MGASMGSRMGSAVGSAVVKNPMFAESFAKAIFQQVAGGPEEDGSQEQHHQHHQQQLQEQKPQPNQQWWSKQSQQQLPTHVPPPPPPRQKDNTINCTQEQLEEMIEWAKKLRMWYISVASFLALTALLSLGSLTVITSGFLAFYVLVFSCLICCFEIGWKMFTRFIVQNFGFLYNSAGRLSFIIFLSMLSWSLGNFCMLSFYKISGNIY
jgi:hypothetical protein